MIRYDHQIEIQLGILQHCEPGWVFEFGVYKGQSLRLFRHADPTRHMVGFDSFEGLPQAWRPGYPQGHFRSTEPIAIEGVDIVKGLFEHTVAPYFQDLSVPVGLVHIDCDLYSSTATVLEGIAPVLLPGVVILFDEYRNYPGYEQHEYRAWQECREQLNLNTHEIACSGHQQSAWQIV